MCVCVGVWVWVGGWVGDTVICCCCCCCYNALPSDAAAATISTTQDSLARLHSSSSPPSPLLLVLLRHLRHLLLALLAMQVPKTLRLEGTLQRYRKCLGEYKLTDRKAYGQPVWKHEGQDRYIAKVSSGNWMVQSEASLIAKKDEGWLLLQDTGLLPHVSRVTWQEGDGNAWVDAPELKCVTEADTVVYYYCYYCYSHYYDD